LRKGDWEWGMAESVCWGSGNHQSPIGRIRQERVDGPELALVCWGYGMDGLGGRGVGLDMIYESMS
jgi:hypothetical protein